MRFLSSLTPWLLLCSQPSRAARSSEGRTKEADRRALGKGPSTATKWAIGGAIGGAVVGASAAALIQTMIPDPSAEFGEVADLPIFPSGERVHDGLARLKVITSELHGALQTLLTRYFDAISDGASAPLDEWVPVADSSSALWDTLYQELMDMYDCPASPRLANSR